MTQTYPAMKTTLTVSKVNMNAGDTATRTLNFVYETYSPYFPTAQLRFLIDMPANVSFVANSDEPSFTDGYDGVSVG